MNPTKNRFTEIVSFKSSSYIHGEQLGYLPYCIPISQSSILSWLFSKLHPFGWRRFPWSLIKWSEYTQLLSQAATPSDQRWVWSLLRLPNGQSDQSDPGSWDITAKSLCGSCRGGNFIYLRLTPRWQRSHGWNWGTHACRLQHSAGLPNTKQDQFFVGFRITTWTW